MYWQEDNDNPGTYQIPDDIVDIVFKLQGTRLIVDHAQSLASAICECLPTASHDKIGVHRIRIAESGNGWTRPDEPLAEMHLSRRTRLVIRVAKSEFEQVSDLSGFDLNLGGEALKLGSTSIRNLSGLTTLFSHGIVCDASQSESEFLKEMALTLSQMSIDVKKMICGRSQTIRSNRGPIFSRALMVADLTPAESVELQQQGIGTDRLLGCGLFIPHKGIEPVFSSQEAQAN